jgi:hypothetical protein
MYLKALILLAFALLTSDLSAQVPSGVQVTVVTDEAEAVLAAANKAARGTAPDSADWARIFNSEGYRRLKEREEGMGRSFTDSAFRVFVLSPALRERLTRLAPALQSWRSLDATSAAGRALAYLPAGTILRARIYPVIKPLTNSFVWDLQKNPAIFFYLDPDEGASRAANTLAHELHHVGVASACRDRTPPSSGGAAMARRWISGFAEGLAVLAAAGGPDAHPHASRAASERVIWDRDVARWKEDFVEVERFLLDAAHGRAGDEAAVTRRGMRFINTDSIPQGPFYTVGWAMSARIERELGRAVLVGAICDGPSLLATYNAAAERAQGRGDVLPRWSDELLRLVR